MQRLAWAGFAFDLPDTWEVTAYHTDPLRGQFQVHDRFDPRGQLTWTHFPAPPDAARLLGDQHRRLREERALPHRDAVVQTRGALVLIPAEDGLPHQLGRWFPERGLWVHWSLDPAVPMTTVDAIAAGSTVRTDGHTERSVFGLTAILPDDFTCERLDPHPGSVALVGEGRSHLRVIVRRLGLARHLLDGRTVGQVAGRLLRGDLAQIDDVQETTIRGHAGARIRYRQRGEHALEKAMGRRWPGEAIAWHDPMGNRLWLVAQVGPRKAPRLDPLGIVP